MRFVLTAGQALRSHGYDPERMRGRRLDEAVPARLAEQLAPHYRAALRGEHRTFENEVPGSELCFEVSVTPVEHDGEIVGGMVIARDVSSRRAAERARAESERRYRELAEHASDVVTRAGPDDVYRYVSPSAKQRYGWAPGQMVGRAVTDFLHPTDHARHAEVRAALAAGADEQVAECRVARATGGWAWVELHYTVERDADGALREVQAAARDITARKVAEAAGRAADAQFRAAFDSAPIGMALVAPNGAWLRVNPRGARSSATATRSCANGASRTSRTPMTSTPTSSGQPCARRSPRELPDGEALPARRRGRSCGRSCPCRSCATTRAGRCTSSLR